jgi:hypothetical protein
MASRAHLTVMVAGASPGRIPPPLWMSVMKLYPPL